MLQLHLDVITHFSVQAWALVGESEQQDLESKPSESEAKPMDRAARYQEAKQQWRARKQAPRGEPQPAQVILAALRMHSAVG